jgi:hypothetical protein
MTSHAASASGWPLYASAISQVSPTCPICLNGRPPVTLRARRRDSRRKPPGSTISAPLRTRKPSAAPHPTGWAHQRCETGVHSTPTWGTQVLACSPRSSGRSMSPGGRRCAAESRVAPLESSRAHTPSFSLLPEMEPRIFRLRQSGLAATPSQEVPVLKPGGPDRAGHTGFSSAGRD